MMSMFRGTLRGIWAMALTLSSTVALANVENGITVVGKATLEQAPDQFTVVLTLEQRTRIITKAKAKIDQQTQLLTRAIKAMGVEDEHITSTNLQLVPIYPRQDNHPHRVYIEDDVNERESAVAISVNKPNKAKSDIAFDIRRQVSVQLSDVQDYEKLLDKALKIGVTRISPVQSGIRNADKLYQQALSRAVANAKAKAQRLASNLGVTLGAVKSLSEHAYRAPGQVMMAAESFDMARKAKSYSGTDQITAEVTVTFGLKSN
ncbi:DUF541 domain-containing protein [Thalassotalea euphylliae]|uniref:DUF541 domain-containing protein n=2 Tax=Thalassotalea euphylliae TaxID=1655234 RepID=A0A3E0TT71_9GAMM|nr:DUF541 domain-containing protein [Thalassotalea euphylliae]